MRAIYEKFTDEEFLKLKKAKEKSEYTSWHDFILVLARVKIRKKGNPGGRAKRK